MAKKILVVRLSSLGDVILTAPVYKNLKAHWPDSKISLLVKPAFAGIAAGMPGVDEIIPFSGLADAIGRIRAARFTHLLDLHGNLRSFIIRRLAAVTCVSVYRKDALARRLFVHFRLPSPALERHNEERYLAALAAWGVPIRERWLSMGDFGGGRNSRPALPPARNALILQSAWLGDSLLTLPLARDVKAALPGCRVTVLTLPKSAPLFQDCPHVDEVILDDKRGIHGGPAGLWRLARALHARRFDLAVIPHRSLRSALLAWLTGAPRRIGFNSSAGRLLLTDVVPFTWLMHDLERNLSLLRRLQPELRLRPDESLYLAPDAAATAAVNARLAEDGVPPEGTVVGVHAGSAWATKRWPAERFAELCRRLRAAGMRAVLLGAASERALCAGIARTSGALDWTGRTDLMELKALMGRLSLMITNDSGPMHLAAAAGVPTLALFGPTTRELGFFPYGARNRVVEHELACRPCSLHGTKVCPAGHFLCMRLITTDEVYAHALAMVKGPEGQA